MLDVWINCPDRDTARRIARAILERRLAACANIYPPIESLYHWKGAIESATETPLLLKTRADCFDALAREARALHPYETPAIHAVRAERATEDYHAWLMAETEHPDRV
jgi:periplasmic divalent cation tolerance protein